VRQNANADLVSIETAISKAPDKTEDGAANRTRTCDPVITNDVLYQLSYCGGPSVQKRFPGVGTFVP
jgi:hypothetical protein